MDLDDNDVSWLIDQSKEAEVMDDASNSKFVRRTLADRRKNKENPEYKGEQRRKIQRRHENDRRNGLRSKWFP